MNQYENTSSSALVNSMMQDIIEGNRETSLGAPTIVRSFSGTLSNNCNVIEKTISPEIDKNKPWREVIKRSFIYGGSNN